MSVIPPKAETTTMTGSSIASTIFFTLKMLFTEPTDVPPNFNTFIGMTYLIYISRLKGPGMPVKRDAILRIATSQNVVAAYAYM